MLTDVTGLEKWLQVKPRFDVRGAFFCVGR